MKETNLQYYERRAREERQTAESCDSAQAASAHRLLAIEYEAEARELRMQAGTSRARPSDEATAQNTSHPLKLWGRPAWQR